MKLSKTKINIGMVRYADIYHPTNDVSALRLGKMMEKLGQFGPGTPIIKRSLKSEANKWAAKLGYKIHWFEKGLGR